MAYNTYKVSIKYTFTGNYKNHNGVLLREIVRLSDMEIGGWIEKVSNLSHEGNCWIHKDAYVYGNVLILENAQIIGPIYLSSETRLKIY